MTKNVVYAQMRTGYIKRGVNVVLVVCSLDSFAGLKIFSIDSSSLATFRMGKKVNLVDALLFLLLPVLREGIAFPFPVDLGLCILLKVYEFFLTQ